MTTIDLATAAIPRRTPSQAALRQCKIISHRGENDNRQVLENTLPAFRAARDAGGTRAPRRPSAVSVWRMRYSASRQSSPQAEGLT